MERAVTLLCAGFRANDEGCRGDKLALVMLSRSATRIGGVPVFANEAFGIRVVHRFYEGAFGFRCHSRFADTQCLVDAAKQPGQVYVTDFVGLDAQVGVVHAEQVPEVEMGIGDFPIRQETLCLHEVKRPGQAGVDGDDLAKFVDPGIFPIGFLYSEPPPIKFLLEPPRDILSQLQRLRLVDGRQ